MVKRTLPKSLISRLGDARLTNIIPRKTNIGDRISGLFTRGNVRSPTFRAMLKGLPVPDKEQFFSFKKK